jgi:hypothetical protein
MLLDFVFHRDLPLDALSARLVEKGKEGIRSLPQRGTGAAAAPRPASGEGAGESETRVSSAGSSGPQPPLPEDTARARDA